VSVTLLSLKSGKSDAAKKNAQQRKFRHCRRLRPGSKTIRVNTEFEKLIAELCGAGASAISALMSVHYSTASTVGLSVVFGLTAAVEFIAGGAWVSHLVLAETLFLLTWPR
jgi:hypothetical protein